MRQAPLLRSRGWLAVAFVVLAVAGCAQWTAGQAGDPYSPSPPGDTKTRPEHGRGNLGGGGDSM
jgi:hypothetical protein